jgi:SGNH domain (fused to AT3 domains)
MTDPAPKTDIGSPALLGGGPQLWPRRHSVRHGAIVLLVAFAVGLPWVGIPATSSPELAPAPRAAAEAALPGAGAAQVPFASVVLDAATLPAGPISSSSLPVDSAGHPGAAAPAEAEPVAAAPVATPPAGGVPVAIPPPAGEPLATAPLATQDSDGDGLTDAFETKWGVTDAHKKDTNGNGLIDSAEDSDGDALSNLGEQRFGTSPATADTDGDGIPDGREDANHNGITNAAEQDRRPLPPRLTPSLSEAPKNVPVSYARGCHNQPYDATIHPCVYGNPHGTTTIVLFGDSHAATWLPAASRAGKTRGWRIVVLTKSSCPSVQILAANPKYPADRAACNTWRKRAETWLRSHPPDLVVITNAHAYTLVDSGGHPIPTSHVEETWQQGLARTLAAMPSGSAVDVLADTPTLNADVPTCLKAHRTRISACETARSKAIDAGHNRAEKAAADKAGATFVTLNGVVCSYDPCPVVAGNVVMWRDQQHLTATFSALLAPSFAAMASRSFSMGATSVDATFPAPLAPSSGPRPPAPGLRP